jgi:hypothetical protein
LIVFNGNATATQRQRQRNDETTTRQRQYSDELKPAFRVVKSGNISLSSASDDVVFRHQHPILAGKK